MKLEILQKETGEPVLVLDQDDMGLAVVGGDQRLVQALKLDQFRDLKEIADYINSDANGPYAAQFEDQQQPEAEQDPAKQLDERMKPALETIRELLSRVQNRQAQDEAKEEAKKPEAELLNSTDSQVVYDPQEKIYVSYDGDNIGNAVARAERKDDEGELRSISNKINAGQDLFNSWAKQNGGEVIEQGGDEGLAKVPAAALDHIEEFRVQYFNLVGATCSVGTGKKISEATDARMLAKLKGKDRVEKFDDATRKELKLRLEDKEDSESRKIKTALEDQAPGEGQPAPVQAEAPAQPQAQAPQNDSDSITNDSESASAAPAEAAPQEQAPMAQMSPELMEALQAEVNKSQSRGRLSDSARYDSQIEAGDYSGDEDPEFSKNLAYVLKYGVRP